MELFFRNIKAFTELFDGTKSGKVFSKDKKDEKQTVAGIRDDDIRENGVGMSAAFTEYTRDTETVFLLSAVLEVDDGSAVIIVDVAVSGTPADRAGLQFRLKILHVGVKKRF